MSSRPLPSAVPSLRPVVDKLTMPLEEFRPTPDWDRLQACFALADDPQDPYHSVQGFLDLIEAVKRIGPA